MNEKMEVKCNQINFLCYSIQKMEVIIMHNLVSYNQLAGWKSTVEDLEEIDHESAVNDYFQCLTECDDNSSVCRRICKEVFV